MSETLIQTSLSPGQGMDAPLMVVTLGLGHQQEREEGLSQQTRHR